MAGVVGYPVSELGKQGGSPAQRPTGAQQDRTRLTLHFGDCTGEYSSQYRVSPLQQTKEVNGSSIDKPGGTAEINLRPCCG